jgi:hypothetical protein
MTMSKGALVLLAAIFLVEGQMQGGSNGESFI